MISYDVKYGKRGKLTKRNHFARIERAAEANVDIVVEKPRIVAH